MYRLNSFARGGTLYYSRLGLWTKHESGARIYGTEREAEAACEVLRRMLPAKGEFGRALAEHLEIEEFHGTAAAI